MSKNDYNGLNKYKKNGKLPLYNKKIVLLR